MTKEFNIYVGGPGVFGGIRFLGGGEFNSKEEAEAEGEEHVRTVLRGKPGTYKVVAIEVREEEKTGDP